MSFKNPVIPRDKEEIICAAIWYKDLETQNFLPQNCNRGVVLCGWRHGNIIAQLKALSGQRSVIPEVGEIVQGFLTSKGRFLNRKEARKFQIDAGHNTQYDDELYSEDLY